MAAVPGDMPDTIPNMLIDVTTIERRRGTPPLGITRVEQKLAAFAINCFPDRAAFCLYDNQKTQYVGVSHDEVRDIVRSIDPGVRFNDPPASFGEFGEAVAARAAGFARPHAANDLAAPFAGIDVFVSVGLLWDQQSAEFLYRIKKALGLRLYFVLYDLVPVIMPEYSVQGIAPRFTKYVLDVAWAADVLYCISNNTMTDIRRYLLEFRAPLPELRRLHLGADAAAAPPSARPARFRALKPGTFVLYVSTIEARKNHQLLFDVWRELYRDNDPHLIPLVFVGREGWSVSDLLGRIERAPGLLPDYLHTFHDIFDSELEWLYANCRFTVYPSLYEGWGLPIVESLSRGKLCLCSNTASMPEAGQGLAETLDPLNARQWLNRISHYLRDDAALRRKERKIRRRFRTQTWDACLSAFFGDIVADAQSAARSGGTDKLDRGDQRPNETRPA